MLLTKKLLRDVRQAVGQFIAAAAVLACGLAVYVGLYSTYRNLTLSRDSYYRQYHFADFFIELERAPLSVVRRVEAIPGVLRARGRIVKDVPVEVAGNDESAVARLISMPEKRTHIVNDIHMVSGSYFSGSDEREVIVNARFCEANDLSVGDSFIATINERRERLRIVGTAYSPEYVYPVRNAQQMVPDNKGFAIVFVKQSFAEGAFNMGSATNSIAGLVRPGTNVDVVLERAKRVLEPYGVYFDYGRDMQLSNHYLSEEIKGLEGSAIITPLVFLIIAGVILHVIMSRIAQMQRTQIGLLCALGYSRLRVLLHYLGFAAVVAALGSVSGALLGQFLAQKMTQIYILFYRFPVLESRFYPDIFATALVIGAGACALGAAMAVRRVASLEPARAMRPPAPPTGRRVMLERFGFLWKRLSLETRTTIRNVVRCRARTFLTVMGVAFATLIMVMGLAANDFFDLLMDFQFNQVDRSDLHVDLITERSLDAVREVARIDGVRHAEGLLQYGFEFRNGRRKKTVLVVGLPQQSRLHRLYDPSGRRINVPSEGLLVPERLTKGLDLAIGDHFTADPYVRGKDDVELAIRGTVEQYLGLTAYADCEYLRRVLGEPASVNGLLVSVERGKLDSVIDRLEDMPGVSATVSNERIMTGFMDSIAQTMRIMTLAQALFAAVTAFAVIYNASTISIAERTRELASMRALGFDRDEVASIGTNDILPLGALGITSGLVLGYYVMKGLAMAFETDLYKVPAILYPQTYATVAALILAFLLVSRYIAAAQTTRIDIVGALKTRE